MIVTDYAHLRNTLCYFTKGTCVPLWPAKIISSENHENSLLSCFVCYSSWLAVVSSCLPVAGIRAPIPLRRPTLRLRRGVLLEFLLRLRHRHLCPCHPLHQLLSRSSLIIFLTIAKAGL